MKNHCSCCCETTPHPAIWIPHPWLQILKSFKTSKKSTKLLSRFSANESTQAVQETRNPAHWNAATPGRGDRQYARKEMKQQTRRKGIFQHWPLLPQLLCRITHFRKKSDFNSFCTLKRSCSSSLNFILWCWHMYILKTTVFEKKKKNLNMNQHCHLVTSKPPCSWHLDDLSESHFFSKC